MFSTSKKMIAAGVYRDRTASFPTALSQIPACGFPAQGSSVLFASYKRKVYSQYPIIRGHGTLK
jgi:hypothetical protein